MTAGDRVRNTVVSAVFWLHDLNDIGLLKWIPRFVAQADGFTKLSIFARFLRLPKRKNSIFSSF